jgi:hypothetical protein
LGANIVKKSEQTNFFVEKIKKAAGFWLAASGSYAPTHDVAPRAVSIADAIDAMS